MLYDEYELLEIFESEPSIIVDKDTGIYNYQKNDDCGFSISLYISVHETFCILTLKYKNFTDPIFSVKLNDVIKIKADNNKLIVSQKSAKDVTVYFKPNFSFDLI